MNQPYYITTAISYPNGKPHIGHAYEAIAGDAIARFQRLSGRDVRFITGTDEHGLKMVQTARDADVETMALADEMSSHFRTMCDKLNISVDAFVRTTEPRHFESSQALWRALTDNGDLYLDRYEGWYSVRDEAFYGADELVVDDNGNSVSPQGTPVVWTAEETWFFRLSKYQQPLLDHFAAHPDFIRPESRRNEVIRFVEGGLRDLSVSRTSFDWGVPVPDSPGHVMYVWVDALTTYLTALGFPNTEGEFGNFWPADVHLIGKDIVRFHTVYWPAFLMSAGLPLPKQVFGHGFVLTRSGEKMGKSAGNAADPMILAERYGIDALRYFLLREISFGQDGSYSEEAIVTRCNADLANNFGNLAQRSLSMIAKNCGGTVPTPTNVTADDTALFNTIDAASARAFSAMEDLAINHAIEAIWSAMSSANAYFADAAPWALRKSDPQRADTILYITAEAIRKLAILCRWIIPDGADKILDLLAIAADARSFVDLRSALDTGVSLPMPVGVFPRLELVPD